MSIINSIGGIQSQLFDFGSNSAITLGDTLILSDRVISTTDGDQQIDFAQSFNSPPVVVAQIERNGNAASLAIKNITTTGFIANRIDDVENADNPMVHYIAIGSVLVTPPIDPIISSFFVATEASSNPTSNQINLNSEQTGIKVYSGDIDAESDRLTLYYAINNNAPQSIEIFKHKAELILAPSNATISLGTSETLNLDVVGVKIPDTLPSFTGITGTANCDRGCPPLWNPSGNHITLPSNYSAFKIAADGTRRQIFIKEFNGAKYLSEKWYWLEPDKDLIVYCDYPDIAIANQDGVALSVEAPTGSVIGGISTLMHFDYPAVTNSIAVTNSTELANAIATVISGQEIVIADGTYILSSNITEASFTANNNAGNVGSEGIIIRSQSDNPDNCIIQSATTTSWNINLLGSTDPCYLRGIKFDLVGLNNGFTALNGTWYIERCKFEGALAVAEDNLNLLQTTGGYKAILLESEINNSAADCVNGNGGGTTDILNSHILLCNCRGSNAGATQSDQVLTSHSGLPLIVYGGSYGNATLNVWANDVGATPAYSYYADYYSGSRECGVRANLYGNKVAVRTQQANVGLSGFVSHNFIRALQYNSTTALFRNTSANLEYNYIQGNAGRGIFQSQGGIEIKGNVITGFTEGIRTSNFAGGNTQETVVINNTVVNCGSGVIFALVELPITLTNNAFKSNTTNLAVATGATLVSNYNTLITTDPDYIPGVNDISAIADLDQFLRPIVNGNCYLNGSDGKNRGAFN